MTNTQTTTSPLDIYRDVVMITGTGPVSKNLLDRTPAEWAAMWMAVGR